MFKYRIIAVGYGFAHTRYEFDFFFYSNYDADKSEECKAVIWARGHRELIRRGGGDMGYIIQSITKYKEVK